MLPYKDRADVPEFAYLVPVFQASFETVLRERILEGLERIGTPTPPIVIGLLLTSEDK